MKYFVYVLVATATIGLVRCCSTDADCEINDSTCSEGSCSCKTGFLESADGKKCLPYVTQYYGDCSEDSQCEWLGENSECNYVCRCKEGYRWYLGQCMEYVGLRQECSNSNDCYDGYNLQSLTCLSGTCACTNGYYERNDTDCRKIASEGSICALDLDCQNASLVCTLGICRSSSKQLFEEEFEDIEVTNFSYKVTAQASCTTDSECSAIKNSECHPQTGTCICKHQYFFDESGTTCMPELGVKSGCKTDTDCPIKPGKCEDGTCYCRDYYFVDDGNRNCVKTMSQNNWNCVSNEWCYALGTFSFCSSLGNCSCSKVADFDEENVLCKLNGQTDPDMCSSDAECKYIENGYCVDEYCGCRPNYLVEGNDTCLIIVGTPCTIDDFCATAVEHTECRQGACRCTENYVDFEGRTCYEIKNTLGDVCEAEVQCSAGITYSTCVNSTCACDEDHLPYKNSCYQKTEFGSYCNNRLECSLSLEKQFGDNIVCRNHMCQCTTDSKVTDGYCSSSSVLLGHFLLVATAFILKGVF